MENYPFGRPPLTPEQTRRAYARQLGIDPSQIDPNEMKLMLNEPGPGQASRTNNTATTTAPGNGGLLSSSGRASTPGGVVWGSQGGLLPGVAGVGPSYGVPGLSGGNWPGQGVSWLPTGSSGMPGGQAESPGQATLAGMSPGGGAGFGVAPVDQNVNTGAAGLLGIPVGSQGDSTDWAAPQGAAPGHGLLGWTAATQQPGHPGLTGTLWGDTVPSPWDRQESPEGWQESGGAGQEEEKPKEAPSPGGTILITTYGTYGGATVGDHSALYIKGERLLNVLGQGKSIEGG